MVKTCDKPTCSLPVEKPQHRFCPKHHKLRIEQKAMTAAAPKCECGNMLSLQRQAEGIAKCPTCEPVAGE